MVEDRVTDGTRIAELLASELDGREDDPLDRVAVVNAREEVDPAGEAARAYDVAADGSTLASAFVHPERVHLAFTGGDESVVEAAAGAAASEGLRTRREASASEFLVSVESGAEAKRAVEVVTAIVSTTGGKP